MTRFVLHDDSQTSSEAGSGFARWHDGLGADELDALVKRRRGGSDHEDDDAWEDLGIVVRGLMRHGARLPIGEPPVKMIPAGDIFNYWDQVDPPDDVAECLASWQAMALPVHTYHREEADDFLKQHFGGDTLAAFRYAHHPAMQADLFRLARQHRLGGLYVDADDVFRGTTSPIRFPAGAALAPLAVCRNCKSSLQPAVGDPLADIAWYYLGNAPLFSVAGHPLVERALDRAVGAVMDRKRRNELAQIHGDTGPGSMSMAALDYAVDCIAVGRDCDLTLSANWGFIEMSRPLDYKATPRNWRTNSVLYPQTAPIAGELPRD